jgi:hypothetical protein
MVKKNRIYILTYPREVFQSLSHEKSGVGIFVQPVLIKTAKNNCTIKMHDKVICFVHKLKIWFEQNH